MSLVGLTEALMLFCFGFAWPFNIYKSFKTRSTQGKSLFFLIVILTGYFMGIVHKLLMPHPDFVLWLYVLNLLMVGIDIALYYRNRVIEKRQASSRAV